MNSLGIGVPHLRFFEGEGFDLPASFCPGICFFLETSALTGDHRALVRARMVKCNVRSSGLPLSCSDWLRTSPCPSCGRCWPPFPSACSVGGWPTAATGSDARILSRIGSATSIWLTQICSLIYIDNKVTIPVYYSRSKVRLARENPSQSKKSFLEYPSPEIAPSDLQPPLFLRALGPLPLAKSHFLSQLN